MHAQSSCGTQSEAVPNIDIDAKRMRLRFGGKLSISLWFEVLCRQQLEIYPCVEQQTASCNVRP